MTTVKDISTVVHSWKGELTQYALGGYDFTAFQKSAMLAISQTPSLQDCFKTQDGKTSIYQAMCFAAITGLSLNPQEGKAALIAYKGRASYQIMKNGMIEIAERSGKVKFISSDTVRENDEFSIEKTAEGDKYTFKPARKSRGEIDGFFAALVLNDGACYVKYMTMQEVIENRDKYSSGYKFAKNKQDAAWGKSIEGMGLKTVIKALLRNVSISPEVSQAIGADDQSEHPEVKNITPSGGGVNSDDIMKQLDAQAEPEVIIEPDKDQKKAAAHDVNDDDQPFFEQ
jgi:phage RecT family recombinase